MMKTRTTRTPWVISNRTGGTIARPIPNQSGNPLANAQATDLRKKLFVYVVESPSPQDLYMGRFEGSLIHNKLKLAEVESTYCWTSNLPIFIDALSRRLVHTMQSKRQRPILHFSMHGSPEGIVLTDGSEVSWEVLAGFLRQVNEMIGGDLCVCMSSCYGLFAYRMAMSFYPALPFQLLVGHRGSPLWSTVATAYEIFYLNVFDGVQVAEAVNRMRGAFGDDGFNVVFGKMVQEVYYQSVVGGPWVPQGIKQAQN